MKKPLPPPNSLDIFRELDRDKIAQIMRLRPLVRGEYSPWDKIRHLDPPNGLSVEEWWTGIRIARDRGLKPTPLLDHEGHPFAYATPDPVLRALHEIDQRAGGRIEIGEEVTNPATRDRYIVSSLIEEAITSSQLEGASTTADVARNMLRTGRKPTDRSEQMILNNFNAMRFVDENSDEELTPELIYELHRIVTDGTLDDAAKAGVFRTDEDEIVIQDERGQLLHRPPPTDQLAERLQQLCSFANDRSTDTFLHPVLRAIITHFWLGYDHPFVDGNGRTARALFYWSMLAQDYWLVEYLSISKILKKAPAQYARSFLYTETDSGDLTYFLDYQLGVILRAIDELQEYLGRKVRQVRRVEALLKRSTELNHRQLALLSNALRRPGARYTIKSHQRSHNVVYETARTDLLELADKGLLSASKRGRSYEFVAPTDLEARLRRYSGK